MIERLKKLWPVKYRRAEKEAVEEHIDRYFGECDAVLHELFSRGVHVDVYAFKPSHKRNFYTLTTCGMGARKMKVPNEKGMEKYARAELVICLPPDWKFKEMDEIWSWPVLALKTLARLPLEQDNWLGYGHTVDFGHPMSLENEQRGALLLMAYGDEGCECCSLPNGEKVWFYQVVPLYREEIELKDRCGVDKLIERLQKVTGVVVNQKRYNVGLGSDDSLPVIMDVGEEHRRKVPELKLPLDEIAGFQHMAIYLRWAMEHEMMSDFFMKEHGDVADAVLDGVYEGDLREFIRDQLHGDLRCDMFSQEGAAFALWYYGEDIDESHYYPCDVDRYALNFFGEAKYHCDAFKDEGYLFVPWTESYYQGMSKQIRRQFQRWMDETSNPEENQAQPVDTANDR